MTDAALKPIRRRRQAISSTFTLLRNWNSQMFLSENQNIHKSQATIPVQLLGLNILGQQNQFIALHHVCNELIITFGNRFMNYLILTVGFH